MKIRTVLVALVAVISLLALTNAAQAYRSPMCPETPSTYCRSGTAELRLWQAWQNITGSLYTSNTYGAGFIEYGWDNNSNVTKGTTVRVVRCNDSAVLAVSTFAPGDKSGRYYPGLDTQGCVYLQGAVTPGYSNMASHNRFNWTWR